MGRSAAVGRWAVALAALGAAVVLSIGAFGHSVPGRPDPIIVAAGLQEPTPTGVVQQVEPTRVVAVDGPGAPSPSAAGDAEAPPTTGGTGTPTGGTAAGNGAPTGLDVPGTAVGSLPTVPGPGTPVTTVDPLAALLGPLVGTTTTTTSTGSPGLTVPTLPLPLPSPLVPLLPGS